MNKFKNLALALLSSFLCLNAYASVPNDGHPTTFLGPTLKARYTAPLSDTLAYSLLGEAGLKNLRVGATLGWRLDCIQRLKFSAEWLRQDITYAFFSGDSNEWVDQWAFGAAYQYDFRGYNYDPAFDLSAYYSHAPSRTLGTRSGTFTNNDGEAFYYTDLRRIAGSNAAGLAPGVSFTPWFGSRAGLEINYDHVNYDNKYISDRDANGLGATIRLAQSLPCNLALNLLASFRQPFNNYGAALGWVSPFYNGLLAVALDAAYTKGKESLPNTWNVGLSFDYVLEPCPMPAPLSLKGEVSPAPIADPFWVWTARPAVYMPQVLAIVDENKDPIPPGCSDGLPPTLLAPLPDLEVGGTTTADAAFAFGGNNLVFSVVTNATPPNGASIDPSTGVMTITQVGADPFQVTVTATNACGSASSTFTVIED
jgi:hypothetical protein